MAYLEMISSLILLVCLMYLTGLVLYVVTIIVMALYYILPSKKVVVYYKNNETGKMCKIKMRESLADKLWGGNE